MIGKNWKINESLSDTSWLCNPTLHISYMTMDKEFRLYVICIRCGAFETAFEMKAIDWVCDKCMK